MNEVEVLKTIIHELKYEMDRLKHEVSLLRISSDSFEKRWDTQFKINDGLNSRIDHIK